MLLNVSAKNYKVIIGGLDCTEAVKTFDGNSSHYENESGLILIDAKIVIGKALGFTENLDDRVNRRWERGKLISIYYSANGNNLPSEKIPVIGTLYILESKFDGKYTLEITAGCLLNLLNFRTPIGDGVCYQLGLDTSISSIAAKLLTKLKITNYSINLPDKFLNIPLPKLTNESYVTLLGKLVWHFKCIIYQDKEGVINIQPIISNTLVGNLRTGQDDIRYERISSNQYPYEIIKAIGIRKLFKYNGVYDQYSPPDQRNMDRLASVDIYFWLNGMLALNNSNLTSGTLIQQVVAQKILISPKEIFDIQRVIHSQRFGITQKLFEYSKGVDSVGRRTLDANYSEEMAGVILPNLYPFSNQLINSVANITHKQFEIKPNSFTGDTVCVELDQGRLLIKVDYVCKPLGVILAKYLENLDRLDSEGNSISEPAKNDDPKAPDRLKTALGTTLGASPFYNLLSTMMIEKMTITTYKYQDNLKKKTSISSGNSFTMQDDDIINEDQIEPVRIEVTTQIWQPEGILYDKINQRIIDIEIASTATDFYTYLTLDDVFERSKLRLIEIKSEVWQKKSPFLINPEIWAYSSTTKKTFAESLSDILKRLEDETIKWNKDNPNNKKYVNADIYHQLYTSETISQSTGNGETTPPSPERFNIGETKEKEITGVATFPAYAGKIYRERTKTINVDSTYVLNKSQLNDLAKLEGQIIIGKFKGISCTTKILNTITRPLQQIIWTDPTFSGVYLIDGCAIACANNRFAMSFDGILWQGGYSSNGGIGGTEKIEYIDYSEYFESSDTYIGVTYLSGYINDYPYALETINDIFSGEITLLGYIEENTITPDDSFIRKAILWGIFDPKLAVPIPPTPSIYEWDRLTDEQWDNMDELSWELIIDKFDSWDNLTDEQWDNMDENSWLSITE